jgi:hypothetical protein
MLQSGIFFRVVLKPYSVKRRGAQSEANNKQYAW